MGNFRIGIVGGAGGQGGSWGRRIKFWKKIEGNTLEFVAIADINELALNKACEKFGVHAYTSYQDMFDKEKLDIVIIATPHYTHVPIGIAALKSGINVLSEKPMCINLKQADELQQAVDKYNLKYAIGFQRRFNPLFIALKRAITSGDLGEIFQINMLFHWWRTEKYYLNSSPVPENKDLDWEGWRGHWKTEGAGALANQLIHNMDIFQWLSPSPIKSVSAVSKVAKHTLIEVDDNTNAVVEFQNGSMGLIQAGVAYEYGKYDEYGVFGTKGALIQRNKMKGALGLPKFFEDYRNREIKKKKRVLSYIPKNFKAYDESKELFRNFVQSIIKDDKSIISVDVKEGRKSVELMRGILLSNKYEKKIKFPFDDPADEFPEIEHTYLDPEFKDLVDPTKFNKS